MRRAAGCLPFVLLAIAAWLLGRDYVLDHPQDFPWTELRLDQPVGYFTGRKLAGLSQDAPGCRALLASVNAAATRAPARREGPQCVYEDGMQLRDGAVGFVPAAPVTSCAVAASLYVFEQQVLQPAARRHFGRAVSRIAHAGSYSCRRLYNRAEGAYSEHATANAFDVTGFQLDDGRTISVLRDWNKVGSKAEFLHEVRDGACKLFATVLSPDYNAAHADHLHLDQARRGASGFRACR